MSVYVATTLLYELNTLQYQQLQLFVQLLWQFNEFTQNYSVEKFKTYRNMVIGGADLIMVVKTPAKKLWWNKNVGLSFWFVTIFVGTILNMCDIGIAVFPTRCAFFNTYVMRSLSIYIFLWAEKSEFFMAIFVDERHLHLRCL